LQIEGGDDATSGEPRSTNARDREHPGFALNVAISRCVSKAGAGVEEDVVIPDVPLFTAGAELCCVAYSGLSGWRLRGFPAPVAGGRGGVGKAKEGFLCAVEYPLAGGLALRGLYFGLRRCSQQGAALC